MDVKPGRMEDINAGLQQRKSGLIVAADADVTPECPPHRNVQPRGKRKWVCRDCEALVAPMTIQVWFTREEMHQWLQSQVPTRQALESSSLAKSPANRKQRRAARL